MEKSLKTTEIADLKKAFSGATTLNRARCAAGPPYSGASTIAFRRNKPTS